jgi:hypothetical protein
MKSTTKQVKLDKTKLFGFNQASSGKNSNAAKPMIGAKTVGGKGGGAPPPPPVE